MKYPSAPLVLSALALLVALAGTALAAGGLITSKQIKDGTIQLRDLSPATMKALQGRTGEQGPAGPAGQQGPQGPQGPAGPKGAFDPAKIKAYDGDVIEVGRGTTRGAIAECPQGSVVIGGGFRVYPGGALRPVTVAPLLDRTPNAFGVDFYNEGSNTGGALAYALCAQP